MQNNNKFDLSERTRNFAKNIIMLLKRLKEDSINRRLITQLVGSSGSIGANYCEAIEAESKKDFIHKILIAKKEIKETEHWIELLKTAHPELDKEFSLLFTECHKLLLIFSKIIHTSKSN